MPCELLMPHRSFLETPLPVMDIAICLLPLRPNPERDGARCRIVPSERVQECSDRNNIDRRTEETRQSQAMSLLIAFMLPDSVQNTSEDARASSRGKSERHPANRSGCSPANPPLIIPLRVKPTV